jgi:predicted  nucleic acid-binding Zn-ribbon protein
LTPNTYINLLATVVTVIGAMLTIYKTAYHAKSERRKLDADGDSAIADAAESVVTAARSTNDLLMRRVEEMEKREAVRENELVQLRARDAAREQEIQEIRRRFLELQEELLEWKNYAFRLAHQLKSLGHEPNPFPFRTGTNSE